MKCVSCGKDIIHPHYLKGKAYGYNCYKLELALQFKKWEDEKNHEYAIKCFSAMEIFKGKKSNYFHDSICKQWEDCKKLTAKQLGCIVKGFNDIETIEFYKAWFLLTESEENKRRILEWIVHDIDVIGWNNYIDDEIIESILLLNNSGNRHYRNGFYFWYDIDQNDRICMLNCGKDNKSLVDTQNDEFYKVVKIVKPS